MNSLPRGKEIAVFAVLMVLVIGGIAYLTPHTTGDQTRPPEAEGKAYVDLDQIDPDNTVVKFDDKWWYVNQTSGELELIGEDP